MHSDEIRKLYRLITLLLAGLALAGCSSTATKHEYPTTRSSDAQTGYTQSDRRRELMAITRSLLGTPYRYGGSDTSGFDCSGLVQYAHSKAGIRVPRTTGQQWRHAGRLNRDYLLPGDLVFFRLSGNKSNHVGIYEGRGVFIHAPSSGKRVSRASLDNPYWRDRLMGSRSFL